MNILLTPYQKSSLKDGDKLYLQLFDRIIHQYISLLIVVAFIDGFAIEKLGLTRIETFYYSGLVVLLFFRTIFVPLPKIVRNYLLAFFLMIVLGILMTQSELARLVGDVRYFFRSILIFVLVAWFYSTTKVINYKDMNKVFVNYWFVISFLILLHLFTGFGGTHSISGRERGIISSYFRTGNVISFVLLLSWLSIYVNTKKIYLRLTITLISLLVAILLSSKAIGLTIVILVFFYWFLYFDSKSIYLKVVLRLLAVLVIFVMLFFWQNVARGILMFFASFVPSGEAVLYKMEVQNLLTVFVSTRDVQALQLINSLINDGLSAWLFGYGAITDLGFEILVESDPFDILKFYGIWGVLFFYLPMIVETYFISTNDYLKKSYFKVYFFLMSSLLATVIVSTITGHIITTPTPMIPLGIIFGVWHSSRLRAQIYLSERETIKY